MGEAESAGNVHPDAGPAVESGGEAFGERVVGEQGPGPGEADLAAVGVAGEVQVGLEVERGPADQEGVVAQDHPQPAGPLRGMAVEHACPGMPGPPSAEADHLQRHAGDLPPLVVHEHDRGVMEVANELGAVVVAGDGVGAERCTNLLQQSPHRRQCRSVIHLVLDEVSGTQHDLGVFGHDLRDRMVEHRLPRPTQVDIREVNEREAVQLAGQGRHGQFHTNQAETGVARPLQPRERTADPDLRLELVHGAGNLADLPLPRHRRNCSG